MTEQRCLVLYSGYNPRAVIALCRFLAVRGRRGHIVAKDREDPIFLTDYAAWVVMTRDGPQLDATQVAAHCLAVRNRTGCKEVSVLPSSEYLNRILCRHADELQKQGIFSPLANEAVYRRLSDKQAFVSLCEESGLALPRELESPMGAPLPFVAKPRCYEGNQQQVKPYLVHTQDQLRWFLEREDPREYFFQEYVEGDSLYLLFSRDLYGRVVGFSQRNLIQQADGRSIIAACCGDLHLKHAVTAPFLTMLDALDYRGLAMFELRGTPQAYRVIEANPRPWGPLQLVVDHCPQLLEHWFADFLEDADQASQAPTHAVEGWYFWLGGLVEDRRNGVRSDMHGYAASQLLNDCDRLMSAEVYARPDSMRLFLHQTGGELHGR